MELNDQIQALVNHPQESLHVELKSWIDPDTSEGKAKIVKASLAIRNRGGGYIVIGFDDKTSEPDTKNIPENLRKKFHTDKIQGLISKYASEPFEVSIHFPTREGQEYPVIKIPAGIKTPIFSKYNLKDASKKDLIKKNTFYVRSLGANGTPSTTEASGKDFSEIVQECFDNREADIGRFIRRHLSGLNPEMIRELCSSISKPNIPQSPDEILGTYLQESHDRFQTVAKGSNIVIPEYGFWEIGMHFIGDIPKYSDNRDFLNLLAQNNPSYTGWPIWAIRSDSTNGKFMGHIWEDLRKANFSDLIDFMRIDPTGKFYLWRTLQDDCKNISNPNVTPLASLNPYISTIRLVEAIAVGISFANAMKCDQQNTSLAFMFKWSKLKNRRLSCFERGEVFASDEPASQDEIQTFVNVPLETSVSAIGEYVDKAIRPLFELFGGFVLNKETIENWTQRVIDKKL